MTLQLVARILCAFALPLLNMAVSAQLPEPEIRANLTLRSPKDFQVFQRHTARAGSAGSVAIAGNVWFINKVLPTNAVLEARFTGKSLDGELPAQWQALPFDVRVQDFRATLPVGAGGWYQLEVRLKQGDKVLAEYSIEHVGVGEIFVVAGQSNSANSGSEKQKTTSGMVTSFDGTQWLLANDPQPGASGGGGSFMPAFGDALYEKYRVPIGVAATGVGATSVRQWLPKGEPIANLPTITSQILTVGSNRWECAGGLFDNLLGRIQQFGPHGFRAVLWHQGESDANQTLKDRTLSGANYRRHLETIIQESQKRAGWKFPWFVAQASYHTPDDPGSDDIRAAQKSLWTDGVAYEGPDTDALSGDLRAGVHFNGKGLQAHGKLWVEKVSAYFDRNLPK